MNPYNNSYALLGKGLLVASWLAGFPQSSSARPGFEAGREVLKRRFAPTKSGSQEFTSNLLQKRDPYEL